MARQSPLSSASLSQSAEADADGPADQKTRDWFAESILELLSDLTGTAIRFTGDRADAEDLVAETVTRAWQHLSTLEDRGRFRGWVFRILTNAWISDCRSRRSRPRQEPLPDDEDCFSLFENLHQPFLLWGGNPERQFLNDLLRDDLERAIDALPDEFRVSVVLADLHGFSYKEIAEMMDVPIGTVRSRLARGRSRLQQSLWQHARERGWVERADDTEPRSAR